ncbi:hypothetical protein KEM54_000811, partial [Ascosphaera aggregata]
MPSAIPQPLLYDYSTTAQAQVQAPAPTTAPPLDIHDHSSPYISRPESPTCSSETDVDLSNYRHLFSGFSMAYSVPTESSHAQCLCSSQSAAIAAAAAAAGGGGGTADDSYLFNTSTSASSFPVPINSSYTDISVPPMIQDPGSPLSSSAGSSSTPSPQPLQPLQQQLYSQQQQQQQQLHQPLSTYPHTLRSPRSTKPMVLSPRPPDTTAHLYRAPTYEQGRYGNASTPLLLPIRFSIDGGGTGTGTGGGNATSQIRSYYHVPRPHIMPSISSTSSLYTPRAASPPAPPLVMQSVPPLQHGVIVPNGVVPRTRSSGGNGG